MPRDDDSNARDLRSRGSDLDRLSIHSFHSEEARCLLLVGVSRRRLLWNKVTFQVLGDIDDGEPDSDDGAPEVSYVWLRASKTNASSRGAVFRAKLFTVYTCRDWTTSCPCTSVCAR